MKAKDTVMSGEEIEGAMNVKANHRPLARHAVFDGLARYKLVAKAQAEISFKAGIKHTLSRAVGEGCLSTVNSKHGIHIPDKLYEELSNEAKLKEWGIKGE